MSSIRIEQFIEKEITSEMNSKITNVTRSVKVCKINHSKDAERVTSKNFGYLLPSVNVIGVRFRYQQKHTTLGRETHVTVNGSTAGVQVLYFTRGVESSTRRKKTLKRDAIANLPHRNDRTRFFEGKEKEGQKLEQG